MGLEVPFALAKIKNADDELRPFCLDQLDVPFLEVLKKLDIPPLEKDRIDMKIRLFSLKTATKLDRMFGGPIQATSLNMTGLIANGQEVFGNSRRFMGLDLPQLLVNFDNLRRLRINISNNERPKVICILLKNNIN